MPKLQKHRTRKKGDKKYTKWVINLPDSKVKIADFKQGDNIVVSAKEGKMILKKEVKK